MPFAGSLTKWIRDQIDTIEFINDELPLLPALASGFLRVTAVRRRFEMIASIEKTARIPGIAGGLLLLVAAVFLCLPVDAGARDMLDEAGPTTPGEFYDLAIGFSRTALDDAGPATAATDPALAEPSRPHKGTFAVLSVVEKVELKMQLSPENPVQRVPVLGDLEIIGSAFTVNAGGRVKSRTAQVAIDPRRHCLYIGQSPPSGQGALRVDLERGATYKVSAAGEAFMSGDTGVDADPFPGVVFYYSTDKEHGYAVRYVVLKPGESVTFKTPWLISPQDEVFAAAFFLDAWPDSDNRGSYTLTFERSS
jgi:hypothetical protein